MSSSPLFTIAAMAPGRQQSQHALDLGDVVDRAVVDSDGRIVIPMIDVLATARLGVEADLLLVEFVDGASRALRMAEVVRSDDVYLELVAVRRRASYEIDWSARLWSHRCGSSPDVASIRATTFATFVGLS